MPSVAQSYEVILDFTNDTHDSATVQLLRDYGCRSNRTVLLNPGETVSLVLDAGDTYKYTLKTKTKVVNITYVLNPTYPQIYCDQSPPLPPSEPEHGETLSVVYPKSSCQGRLHGRLHMHPRGHPLMVSPLTDISEKLTSVYSTIMIHNLSYFTPSA